MSKRSRLKKFGAPEGQTSSREDMAISGHIKPSVEGKKLRGSQKPSYGRICNYRASTREDYEEWQRFKQNCIDQGLDICYVVTKLISTWNRFQEGISKAQGTTIASTPNIVNLQMQNTFVYQPLRARREPDPSLISSRKPFARTISSKAAELYVLWKVSDLERSFSYLDLSELPSNYARKLISRLRKKGLIIPIPPRTRPRFYTPTVRLSLEPVEPYTTENNRVKLLFSPLGSGE